MRKSPHWKNDLLLILALLLVSGGAFAVSRLTRQEGALAVVTADGEELYRLPLSEPVRIEIGEAGNSNTLVIEDGAAYMEQADCPDKVCVRQGKARYTGDTIVCLPHKLSVTITGGEETGIDAVVR